MDDTPLTVVWMLSVLGIASFIVLSLVARRVWRRIPVLPAKDEELPAVPDISLIIVAMWVGMALLTLVGDPAPASRALKPSEVEEFLRSSCIFQVLLFLAIFVPMISRGGAGVAAFGFHLKDVRQHITFGVLGFAACILPVMGFYCLTLPFRTMDNSHGLLQLLQQEPSFSTVAWVILSAIVLAPLVEELVYRVVLQTWLQKIAPPREALFAVAVIFAAIHRLPDAIPLLPLALVLGYMYQQRRSFLTIVLIHMLFNAANLTMAMLTPPSS